MRPRIEVNVRPPTDAEEAGGEEMVASFTVTPPLALEPFRFDMNIQELALVVLGWLTLRNDVELKLSKLPADRAKVNFSIGPHPMHRTPAGPDELAARFLIRAPEEDTVRMIDQRAVDTRFELPVQKIAAGILHYFTARSEHELREWSARKQAQERREQAAQGKAIVNPEGML